MLTNAELKNLNPREFEIELQNVKRELLKLRFEQASNQLKETHKLKLYRRYMARLRTMKRVIELEAPKKKAEK